MLSNPKIIARCEIDLSPGKVTVPVKAPARRAERGWGVPEWLFDMKRVLLDWKNNSTRRRAASRPAPLAHDAEGVIPEDTPHDAILRKMRFPFDSGRTRD
jgi:hypothetical protein